MSHIKRTIDGTYRARLDASRDGRRYTRTKTFPLRKDAQRWLTDQIVVLNRGEYVDAGSLTLGQWMRSWLDSIELAVELGDLAPNTAIWYRSAVERHIVPELGRLRLAGVGPEDLERFYAKKLRVGRVDRTGGLGQASVRRLHITLRRAFEDALRRRLISTNPASQVSRVPSQPSPNPHDRVWTADQVRTFLAAASDDRLSAAFRLAAVTGMRRGEVLGLRWQDLDLDEGQVRIRRTLVMVGGSPQISKPKTDQSARTVSVDGATVAAVRHWRKSQLQERVAWGAAWRDSGHVFTREDGMWVRPDWFTRRFKRIARDAGLPVIPLHGLRHSAATFHLEAGTPIAIVSSMLGHSSSQVTMDIYSAVLPRMTEAAVTRFADALDG